MELMYMQRLRWVGVLYCWVVEWALCYIHTVLVAFYSDIYHRTFGRLLSTWLCEKVIIRQCSFCWKREQILTYWMRLELYIWWRAKWLLFVLKRHIVLYDVVDLCARDIFQWCVCIINPQRAGHMPEGYFVCPVCLCMCLSAGANL